MRISKLRRTLAVFLSALMITLCVPFSGITASASISAKNLNDGSTLQVNSDVITYYDYRYTKPKLELYFYWKDQYSSGELSGFYEVVGNDMNVSSETLQSTYSYQGTTSVTTSQVWTVRSKNIASGTCKIYLESDQSKSFDITLDANGGTLPGGTTNPVKAENGKLTDEQLATAPTRTGFSFSGWYTSATGGTKITSTYTFSSDTTIFAHWEHTAHDWDYTASGNKITAKCTQTGCQYNTTGVTLTLNADNRDYAENTAYSGASIDKDSDFPGTYTNSDIKYKSADGTTYPESATAPTNVGSYVAYVTAGDKTASKQFSINALTMSGISAADVTKTYDGENSYGITVTTGTPADAVIKYGEAEGSCTLDESPKYMNAGVYTVYYKVTKENYNDKTGSATVTINKADYPNEKTASANILAGTALTDVTVTLPAVPANMSYGTPSFTSPVTAASISGNKLKFSTNSSAAAGSSYTINVPVNGGAGANYADSTIIVTLTAINCTHENRSDLWSSDADNHWHECPDCHGRSDVAAHSSSGPATEDNDEHCTVCGYVINPTLDHLCGRTELTFVPEVPETCTTDGTKAHYECRCGKLYSDKNAAVEVTAADLRIPAHHVWSEAWSNDETQHYHLCTVCDEKNDTTLHTYGDWTITKLATPTADGEKERSCSVCGYVQTGVVNYIPDNTDNDTGDINNTTDADSNACHGDTELTKSEIIEKIDLTPEELTAVENGEDINIFLTVEDNSANVSESDKALTESVLNNDDTIAMYLDIKLFKQVGENSPTQITNTNGDVTIVFEMPESIICTDKNVTREYFIIRVHEGTAETLKCTFDPATGKASFMTDKFSSYAIVYKDTVDTVTNDAEEAAEEIEKVLDDLTPDNNTTAENILSEIEDVNDDNVTIEISSFKIVPATEDSEGRITVTIVITDSEGNAETVEKEIVIPKLPKPEKPAVTIYYPVITSGNVSADRSSAAAGETVNVKASFGYDIIVTAANGRQIAKMTENGSFVMPASKVYVTAVQNETFALMATAWRNSYVYSYDSDMNKIKVSSTKKQGVIVVNLGEDYAGKSFTIYSGRKSTKVKVTEGVLDEKGKFVFEVPDGRNYTLVVED